MDKNSAIAKQFHGSAGSARTRRHSYRLRIVQLQSNFTGRRVLQEHVDILIRNGAPFRMRDSRSRNSSRQFLRQ